MIDINSNGLVIFVCVFRMWDTSCAGSKWGKYYTCEEVIFLLLYSFITAVHQRQTVECRIYVHNRNKDVTHTWKCTYGCIRKHTSTEHWDLGASWVKWRHWSFRCVLVSWTALTGMMGSSTWLGVRTMNMFWWREQVMDLCRYGTRPILKVFCKC